MILIVDDKPENIFSLEKILKFKGFRTDSALSGEEALKKCLKNEYALIILDVQMPEMDGYEVAEFLSSTKKTKDIPIIFLSAVNREKKYIAKGYESGGIDYITKPVDPEILLLKVNTFYRLYEQTAALHKMQEELQREIEWRKSAQNELSSKFEELNTTLESLPQVAFTTDSQGNVDFVNEQWFRYSHDRGTWPELHPEDVHILENWKLQLADKLPWEAEVRLREKQSDNYRYHLLKLVPVAQGTAGHSWVGTMTDIDERKQLENKKDEFLSVASHELKTPLTSIKAFAEISLRSMKDMKDHRAYSYLSKVKEQAEKLHSLVEDLLDISRLENGGIKIALQEIDFEDLIQQAADSALVEHHGTEIRIERTGVKIDRPILADPLRLEQVLTNYLSNAIKYAPGTQVVRINTFVKDNILTLEVSDNGIGIPEQKIPFVFDKFYRVQEASAKFQGLGLGLHICKEIISLHGGACGARSKLGEGSTFYFTLPINK